MRDCCNTAPRSARYLVILVVLLLAAGLAAASGALEEAGRGQPAGAAASK
jgi:hypothetical protein